MGGRAAPSPRHWSGGSRACPLHGGRTMAKIKETKVAKGAPGPVVDADGFEIIGGGDGAEMAVGEVVEGLFGGITRSLPAKKKGQPPLPIYAVGTRTLLGGTVLRARFEEGGIKVGDLVRVTRLADAPKKPGRNPAKLFQVGVKRAKNGR